MGSLNDAVRKLIQSLQITSAGGDSPKINEVLQMDASIDLDESISENKEGKELKKEKEVDKTIKKVKKFDAGNIGDVNRFTSQQMGNLKGFVQNPSAFIIQAFVRKFAKGVGIIALALIIFEAVKWVISEMLKPGRFMDLRFKRVINDEIIAFRRREDQQKIKQGFSSIIITSIAGLRGGQNQILNTFDLVRERNFPANFGYDRMLVASSGVSTSKSKGTTRGNIRFNR